MSTPAAGLTTTDGSRADTTDRVELADDLPLERASDTPLYLQLQQLLDAAMDTATHGARLPSEHEIAGRYGVSRHVARQALDRLVAEGRAVRRHGVGYFVNRHRFTRSLPTLRSFTSAMQDLGLTAEYHVVEAGTESATGQLRRLIRASETDVFRLVRLAVVAGEPVGRIEGYYPVEIGTSLDLERVAAEGVYRQLTEFGIFPAQAESVLRIRFADVEVADQLSIPPGGALYEVACWTTDGEGRSVEFSRELDRADRFEFSFTARAVSSFELSERPAR